MLVMLVIERQKKRYKLIVQLPQDLVRRMVCDAEGQPARWAGSRRRERPRQQWTTEVFKLLEQSN